MRRFRTHEASDVRLARADCAGYGRFEFFFPLFSTSDSCILAYAQGLLGPTTGPWRFPSHDPLLGWIYHKLAFEVEKTCQ
jgi:hypothetical protein